MESRRIKLLTRILACGTHRRKDMRTIATGGVGRAAAIKHHNLEAFAQETLGDEWVRFTEETATAVAKITGECTRQLHLGICHPPACAPAPPGFRPSSRLPASPSPAETQAAMHITST